jgi:hypothetical protein
MAPVRDRVMSTTVLPNVVGRTEMPCAADESHGEHVLMTAAEPSDGALLAARMAGAPIPDCRCSELSGRGRRGRVRCSLRWVDAV